jgi:hypothetical protein|tara:strand:- start:204 stop:602 length:399 start_codon:yes stop_codon:yes gene_type:complete
MQFSEIELPSNKKFGFFFTFVFAIASTYFYNATSTSWAYTFGIASLTFLIVSTVKAEILLPLNKLWMRFGHLLGMIISPIVLGILFFMIFTPIAFIMQLIGRDELRLKFSKKPSHWISRSEPIKSESFKDQF